MSAFLHNFLYPFGWFVVLGLALIGLWRISRGPTTLDRMVGLDTFTIAAIGMAVVFSLQHGAVDFIELVIVVTALGFFTTVAFYYYLAQPKRQAEEDFNEEKEEVE